MFIAAPTAKNATKTQSDGATYVVYGTGTSQNY